MKTRSKLGALLGAGALVFALAGVASAALNYATPWGHYASSAGDKSNEGAFWESYLDLPAGSCTKTDESGLSLNEDGSVSLGVAADWVIVKQANPHAKDVTYDNTIFKDVTADQTVYADTNGDNDYDTDDSNGISHVIVCGPAEESQPPTEAPSFSFEASNEGATDVPTEPNTATVGAGTSSPSDGSWLFVAALGVILASVVVLTPARAKNRR